MCIDKTIMWRLNDDNLRQDCSVYFCLPSSWPNSSQSTHYLLGGTSVLAFLEAFIGNSMFIRNASFLHGPIHTAVLFDNKLNMLFFIFVGGKLLLKHHSELTGQSVYSPVRGDAQTCYLHLESRLLSYRCNTPWKSCIDERYSAFMIELHRNGMLCTSSSKFSLTCVNIDENFSWHLQMPRQVCASAIWYNILI